ncbi:hypothetical protein ABVK25_009491 [Lepraria finkii]|uniref:Uncharacterized protein n=1 Tax=Lepraria finkii TaxID=1340010 RepID=A0ABR4AX77_9LECA
MHQHPDFCYTMCSTPALQPRSYHSSDLVDGSIRLFGKGFADLNEKGVYRPIGMQEKALERWNQSNFQLNEGTNEDFPLQLVLEIFDNYFFCGALRKYTDVVWTDENSDHPSYGHISDLPESPSHVLIHIVRPPSRTWTHQLL